MKKIIFKTITYVFILTLMLNTYTYASDVSDTQVPQDQNTVQEYNKEIQATVVELLYTNKESTYEGSTEPVEYQYVKVKVTQSGENYGKEYMAQYNLSSINNADKDLPLLKKGQSVYIMLQDSVDDSQMAVVTDVNRVPYILVLVAIFFAVILLIGKKQGLKTIISLVLTVLSIFYILIPAIINGYNAMLISIIICVIVSLVTLVLVGGINKKTLVSIIGTVSGVIMAGILALVISNLASITGLNGEETQALLYLSSDMTIDISGLFFASILIGTVGATMDISMSISSAMNELEKKTNLSRKEIVKSGLNVGRDAMGTMSNTLILAYVGESLNLIILFMIGKQDLINIINSDYISSEILRALCGTIGMLLVIPITAVVYGLLMYKKENTDKIFEKVKKSID